MDRFGIGKIGLTGFGVGEFCLPVFGAGRSKYKDDLPQPSIYYDFSTKDNNSEDKAVATDLSGNGLNGTLNNFAFALGSGYGEYTVDFTLWKGTGTTSDSVSIIKDAGINKGFALIYYNQMTSDIPSYSVRITGLNSGEILFYYRDSEGVEKHISYIKDGVYTLPICYKEGAQGSSSGFTINSTDKITITQLPSAYEGSLVFDGVDDYIFIPNITKGYKTVFMDVVPQHIGDMLYDQRQEGQGDTFAIYAQENTIAYNSRNSGVTYINGVLNVNATTNSLLDKRQVITALNDNVINHNLNYIGCSISKLYFSKMALYKFLAFEDYLSEAQIKAVINKYNLNKI